MSQVFDPNDPRNKNNKKKYTNWRDAAYDRPENTTPYFRDNGNRINDLDSTFKLISKSNSIAKEVSGSASEKYYESVRKTQRKWRL